MSLPLALGVVGLAIQMNARKEQQGTAPGATVAVTPEGQAASPPQSPNQMDRVEELLERQIANEERREAPRNAVDAYVGLNIELSPGETVIVEVTPSQGSDLRVSRIEIDRRDEHDYSIGIDGIVLSGSHRAAFDAPRVVRNGGKVFAEVTNNTASNDTVVDFELEGWTVAAEP